MRFIWRLGAGLSLFLAGFVSSASALPPPNDNFSSPLVLAGFPSGVISSNVDATLQPGEPDPANYVGDVQASVWFRWTSPTSGAVQIDTFGSDFDTVLAVWTGAAVNALTMLEDNDQFGGNQSAVFISAVSGVTYQIAVYGWYEDRGSIHLTVTNDTTSTIAGLVTGPAGLPAVGVQAQAYRYDGFYWNDVNDSLTAGDGSYEIRNLLAGTYRVRFRDINGNYVGEYYDDAPDLYSATDIEVPASTRVDGIDAELAPASKISGSVTGSDGVTPATDIDVHAYVFDGFGWSVAASSTTDGGGNYTVGGLTADTYRVEFSDDAGNYVREVYDDQSSLEDGLDIVVAATTTVTSINASLREASRITGIVTGPDETTPLEDITVRAHAWDGSGWSSVSSDQTDGAGLYSIGGLTGGVYRVQFQDPMGTYIGEVYANQATLDDGQDIVVASTSTVTGIDASLSPASKISGTVTGPGGVTPLYGVWVTAWHLSGSFWITAGSSSPTDANGNYTLGGLAAGTYRVGFDGSFSGYAPEFYEDAPNVNSATDVVVPLTSTVFGIDASLSAEASISGTVTGPDEVMPLTDISVTAYRWNGSGWDGSGVYTDGSGVYTINGLAAGNYRIEFRDNEGNFITEYYNNMPDLDSGLDVAVAEGEAVSGIDASLAQAGRISGHAYESDGTTPIDGLYVSVHAWSGTYWNWINSDNTDALGAYSVGGLPAGTYRVLFADTGSGTYLTQAYSNAPSLDDGLDVVVPDSTEINGIDVAMQAAARIEGTITRRDGVTVPSVTIEVDAYRWNGVDYDYQRGGSMNPDGTYALGGLPGGTYRLYFADWSGTRYQNTYYTNSPTILNATDIVVPAGTTASGIDVSLTAFSRILGRVTRTDGSTPIPDVNANVYHWSGLGWDQVNASASDTGGYYVVDGLYSGSYRVQFVDNASLFVSEVYDNAGDLNAGVDVVAPEDGDAVNVNARLGLDIDLNSVPPAVLGFVKKAGAVWDVRFTAASGLIYRVRGAAGLTNGWQDHTAPMVSQGGTNTLSVTGSTDRAIFSILAEP